MQCGGSLTVYEGETLALLGASGCGKTTTLKMLNRLIEPTRGEIWIYGRNALDMPPTELRRQKGYVFQGIGLMLHMTVLENGGLTLRVQGVSRAHWQTRARTLCPKVQPCLGRATWLQQHLHDDSAPCGCRALRLAQDF